LTINPQTAVEEPWPIVQILARDLLGTTPES